MEILSVIGTRPQYVKLGAMIRTFEKSKVTHGFIDTGQHYSHDLSEIQLKDLLLPNPIMNLNVGSATAVKQVSEISTKLFEALTKIKPKFILVYGDTNSTWASAFTAAKMNIPVGHVEAGLRSFNKNMPEEVNRILTDHVATRLYAPTHIAMQNLKNENLQENSIFTGDLMVESLEYIVRRENLFTKPNHKYFVATFHREENMVAESRLRAIFNQLSKIKSEILIFAHPRLLEQMKIFQIQVSPNVKIREPQSHSYLIKYISNSQGVITDSGGLQKECYMLGVLCTTVRNEIEWIETLSDGWNVLCKNLDNLSDIVLRNKPSSMPAAFYGTGNASNLILNDILNFV